MDEPKKAVLIRPPLSCHWGPTDECLRNGRVTRLSFTYRTCFIQTKAPANDGQTMFLKVWLPDDLVANLSLADNFMLMRGTVAHYSPKIGFGLHFDQLADAENEMLSLLVNFYRDKQTEASKS
jgi:hypothetical protein